VADQAVGIAITLIMAKTLDALILKDVNLLFYFIVLYPIVNIIRNRIGYYQDTRSLRKMDQNILQFLQEFSFTKIFKLTPKQFAEDHSSIKLQVVDRGENAVSEIVSRLVLDLFPILTQVTFSLIAISFYSKIIAAWCLFTVVVVVWWSNKFAEYHRPMIKKNMDNWDAYRKIRTEAFQHLSLIKIISVEKKYLLKYLKDRSSLLSYYIDIWTISYRHSYRRGFFMIFSRTFSFVFIVVFYLKSYFTIGSVYALWSWINDTYNQIQNIVRLIRQLPLRYVELEKYLEIIDKEADFKEESDIKFVDGDIVFENLSFKYPKGDSNVLDNINIHIKQGQKVAFVGASGSGKTTITRLLLRAYDYENQIKNENKLENSDVKNTDINKDDLEKISGIKINGVELKDIDAPSLRRAIGYVEQHVDLFDDTIKNNILLGVDEKVLHDLGKEKSEKTFIDFNGIEKNYENKLDEYVEEIAKLARIDEFYHRLGDKKFETEIGERGIKLSGGERQRIGIARAIIKNPAILIFDEATSALDTVNEKYIKEAIDNVSKGRTTIIIAHRLSTVIDSDIIFVMNLGKVVASGTHAELIENSEYYQELIKHQDLK
jgi:ABC-type multidrug transport system fused ATPase/permease subunit